LPQNIITLADFLEPYLSDNGAKKGKPIPEWLFETSEADQADLDTITIFGLELNPNHEDPSHLQPIASASSPPTEPQKDIFSPMRLDKGKGKERAGATSSPPPFPIASKASAVTTSFQTQTPPVPLAQHIMSTQTATQQFNLTQSPLADNEESEDDGDIPIVRPRQVRKIRSRVMIDPLAYPSSSGELASATTGKVKQVERDVTRDEAMEVDLSDDEVDSEDLSEYEKEARRQRKRKRTTSPRQEVRNRPKVSTRPIPPPQDIITIVEDESIPASESIESLSLTKRYPSPGKTVARPIDLTSIVVHTQGAIDHGVHSSFDKNGESLHSNSNEHSNESSLPTPPPSDHDHEVSASFEPPPPVDHEILPKTEPTSAAGHRRTVSKSSGPASKVEADDSRNSRTEIPSPFDRKPDVPGPSRSSRPHSNARPDQAGSSTPAILTIAQSIKKETYTLNLAVDGLTAEEVDQYTEKVKAARAKQRPA
jgi:hypothetical protein